jgi:PAS domain S-box-containing protein
MAEGRRQARILLIEDEALIGLAESRLLSAAGYEVALASTGEAGLGLALDSHFDLVLMDVNLGPGMDGGRAARAIRDAGGPPVVFLSAHFEESAVAKTRDSGGYGYIVKGSGDRVLLASIDMALELAAALSGLKESDSRREGLARRAPDESRLAMGEALDEAAKTAELRSAMASFDFGPVRDLLSTFYDFARVHISFMTSEGEIYSSSGDARACRDFHRACLETAAGCEESDRRVEALLHEPMNRGYVDYRCANGLRDIALPLAVEGVHWGTLFLGQFLYDDDDVDEDAFALRAKMLGWDIGDYLSSIREVPRYSRARMGELMPFFTSLGAIITKLAYGAFKERVLSRHTVAAEAAQGESDKLYRLLAENVGDVLWTLDATTMRFSYVSPSIMNLRGMSAEEAMMEPLEASMSPASLQKVGAYMGNLMERVARGEDLAGESLTDIYEQPFKGGGMKWVEISTKPVFDAEGRVIQIAGVSRDATARVLSDLELKKVLGDKDRLYSELQHRVKNSLALIVSLLSLEAGSTEEDSAKAALEEAQVRVRSVALLYEQLYRTHSVGDIDLGAYLSEVARTVVESPMSPRGLRLELDCDSFRIATDRAVPAGLLLYELAANSIKHAFPGGGVGRIRLSLRSEDGGVLLRFEDDGVGLEAGFDLESSTGLGSLLISQLAAQLGGSARPGPGLGGSGAGFDIGFPLASPR